MDLLISFVAGAVFCNVAAGIWKEFNLGLIANSVIGVIGGAIGGQLLLWFGAGGLAHSTINDGVIQTSALFGQIATAGIFGATTLVAATLLRNFLTR